MSKVKAGAIGALAAGAIAAAVAIVAPWEGLALEPYRDIVGKATVCYGDTHVEMREYTRAECEALLSDRVYQFYVEMDRCIAAPVTTDQMAAILSWSYNVGTGAACGSTLVRQINAGQPASVWCKQLLRWDRAGGRKVRGLTLRRQSEYEVCVR